jgi:hypothetical protein
MTLVLKLFFLPGNLVANRLGATQTDDRAMIRTFIGMLFWSIVTIIVAFISFR